MKKILTGIAVFITMAVICVFSAGAETFGDYKYEVLEDGTVSITDYTGSASVLEIPSEIGGKAVTSIGDLAFSECKSLTSLSIPDSVTSIGRDAFSHCHLLTNIVIPSEVTTIGTSAFSHCQNLESITLPTKLEAIPFLAFANCKSLTEIIIPNGVVTIEASAFLDSAITSITIPVSVQKIDGNVFSGCTFLEYIIYEGTTEQWNAIDKSDYWYEGVDSKVVCIGDVNT